MPVNTTRRLFFKGGIIAVTAIFAGVAGLLKPLTAFAERNREAFSARSESEALSAFFPDQKIETSEDIDIGVHDVVENGAYVPVNISTKLPGVSSITILVDKNPNPLIANFNLAPECTAFIATRVKMAEPSDVIAVVRSQNKLFSARKYVEVIAGGCGS